ncbi:MAG: DUF2484 family protein [Rhodobacteraceae bacterium]|nr:DUF2484 family protein [Paracoccaceae bacterium]
MISAVVFAAIWIGMGTVIAFLPRRYHPPCALMLLLLLVPLIPYLWIAGNPFLAVMFLAGVGSILRWPLFYISRMVLRLFGIRIEKDRFEASGYRMTDRKSSENGG